MVEVFEILTVKLCISLPNLQIKFMIIEIMSCIFSRKKSMNGGFITQNGGILSGELYREKEMAVYSGTVMCYVRVSAESHRCAS